MKFVSQNLEIISNSQFGLNSLHFIFKGKFTEEASIKGTEAWSKEFDEHSSESYHLIWDCTDMSGFEPAARKEWYNCMKLYKKRIREVTVISQNILIRGAARVMLEFFGLQSRMVRSIEELLEEA